MTQLFTINGMHCEACTKLSAKRIRSIDGVTDASVELASGVATVMAERPISVGEINEVLTGSDYRAEENNG